MICTDIILGIELEMSACPDVTGIRRLSDRGNHIISSFGIEGTI